MNSRIRWLCGVALLSLAAVGGCSGGGRGRPSPNVTQENLCQQVADVLCYNMFECCTGKQIEDILGVTISVTHGECLRDMELICEDQIAPLLYAVDKGTAVIRENETQVCLDAMLVSPGNCFQVDFQVPWQQYCREVWWSGLQNAGQDCVYDLECMPQLYCAADRKCRAYPQFNELCPSGVCATGLYCSYEDGRCKAKKGVNQECRDPVECLEGLYCGLDNLQKLVCQAPRNFGEPCRADFECQSNFCIPGLCSDGKECYRNEDCAGRCEFGGQACASDYTCPGKCPNGTTTCQDDYDCTGIGSGVCFHERCIRGCNGQPVCGLEYRVIDYCTDTVGFFMED